MIKNTATYNRLNASKLALRGFMAFIVMVMSLFLIIEKVHALPVNHPPLSLEYLKLVKEKNGQSTRAFAIHYKESALDSLTVVYRLNQDPMLYEARIKDRKLSVSSDTFAFIHLVAYGRSGNRRYVATTDFCLFGKSDTPVQRHPAPALQSDIPMIRLVAPRYNYWPQTGQQFQFELSTGFSADTLTAGVLDEDRFMGLEPDENMRFSHVPDHDKRLRNKGVSAWKQETVIGTVQRGDTIYSLSYALLLHRSRTAFMNGHAGIVVFFGSILFFLGWVIMKRKLSKTPW